MVAKWPMRRGAAGSAQQRESAERGEAAAARRVVPQIAPTLPVTGSTMPLM